MTVLMPFNLNIEKRKDISDHYILQIVTLHYLIQKKSNAGTNGEKTHRRSENL